MFRIASMVVAVLLEGPRSTVKTSAGRMVSAASSALPTDEGRELPLLFLGLPEGENLGWVSSSLSLERRAVNSDGLGERLLESACRDRATR